MVAGDCGSKLARVVFQRREDPRHFVDGIVSEMRHGAMDSAAPRVALPADSPLVRHDHLQASRLGNHRGVWSARNEALARCPQFMKLVRTRITMFLIDGA